MNIHFDNLEQHCLLRASTLFEVQVGSKLYGLQDSQSDKDILCVFVPNDDMLNSVTYKHSNHQYQYKHPQLNVDFIYTDVFTFIQNILNGDSSINFEAIHDESILSTPLAFLFSMRKEFYTHKVMRGYLGKVKKDLDNMYKYGKDERGYNKKLIHAYRGIISVNKILNNNYSNKLTGNNLHIATKMKGFNRNSQRKPWIENLRKSAENNRKQINKLLGEKQIRSFLSLESQQKLDKHLLQLSKSDLFLSRKIPTFDMNLIYNAIENGINY